MITSIMPAAAALAASAWHGKGGRPFGAVRCGLCVVGLQAFSSTSAYNADLGAWNTAAVTTLSSVCAPSAVAHIAAAHSKCGCGSGPAQMCASPGTAAAFYCSNFRMSWRTCSPRCMNISFILVQTCTHTHTHMHTHEHRHKHANVDTHPFSLKDTPSIKLSSGTDLFI